MLIREQLASFQLRNQSTTTLELGTTILRPRSLRLLCYDLITQVATLALRLEDGLRVRRKEMHNRLSIRRYSVSTGAYILIMVQELGLQ